MRKLIMILGTLLIATILISGPVIAAEEFIIRVENYENCTNQNEAVGSPDSTYATIGVNPSTLGWIELDFATGTSMSPDQNFTIYGMSTGETETYNVTVIDQDRTWFIPLGSGEDTTDEVFTTPSTEGLSWRWVNITATSGNKGTGDLIYGPEIDAVGYEP
jgi:hypothetical protein